MAEGYNGAIPRNKKIAFLSSLYQRFTNTVVYPYNKLKIENKAENKFDWLIELKMISQYAFMQRNVVNSYNLFVVVYD